MSKREERRRLADKTITRRSSTVYSEMSDDCRLYRLDSRQKTRGLARLSAMAHRGYKACLSRILRHRLLRMVLGFIHGIDINNIAISSIFVLSLPIMGYMGMAALDPKVPDTFLPTIGVSAILISTLYVFLMTTIQAISNDRTLDDHHITTHVVLDDHFQEHTIIVSTMDGEHTDKYLKMTEAELDAHHSYEGPLDLQDLTIWSPIPLSKDQIAILSDRDFLMVQQRAESSDARYDFHDYRQVSESHDDARLPLYQQCVDLINDNLRLIEHLDQQSLADQLHVISSHMSDAKSHGLNMSSDMTIRELKDMLGKLDDIHDQLLVLNEDYSSIQDDNMILSKINDSVHAMTNAETVS